MPGAVARHERNVRDARPAYDACEATRKIRESRVGTPVSALEQ